MTFRPSSLLPSPESIGDLSDAECLDLFSTLRWPDGPRCPRCNATKLYELTEPKRGWRWKCGECRKCFSVTTGTPFANRKARFRVILTILSLVQRARGEVVILRMAGEFKVAYKTAYTLVGKANEFLNGGIEKPSAFSGYWAAKALPRPRSVMVTAQLPRGWRIMTRANWGLQEKQNLSVLCAAGTPVETAASILSRSASSLAYRARDMGLTLPKEWSQLITPKRTIGAPRAQLFYPFVDKARPSNDDLLRVNDLVPRGFPEHMRADICQSVMLALYEGEITLADLQANRSNLKWFIKKWHKEQDPYQEVSLSTGEDERPYYEIAADAWHEWKTGELNAARYAYAAFAGQHPATQIDDVFEGERSAARVIFADTYLDPEEIDERFERGELPVSRDGRAQADAYTRGHFQGKASSMRTKAAP